MLSPVKTRITVTVLSGALGLWAIFGSLSMGQFFQQAALTEKGAALVDAGLQDNARAFLALSAVKAALALVEGSSIGVGFDLQLGDMIQPAYDYVDFIWRVFLWANVILLLYKILLETGLLSLGVPLAGLGLLFWTGGIFPWPGAALLRLWGRRLFMAGLLVAYLIPLSLMGANTLSQHYTQPLKDRQKTHMVEMQHRFQQARQQFLNLRADISLTRPSESVERIKNSVLGLVHSISNLTLEGGRSFLYYILVLFFELLVLPFLTAFILYQAVQALLGQLPGRWTGLQSSPEYAVASGPPPAGKNPDSP